MKIEKQTTQTLPNGLLLYKLMRYKVTKEKCQIVKFTPEKTNNAGIIIEPLSVNIRITRIALGIPYNVIIENISQYDLEVWNEKMNPTRTITYLTKKRQERTECYTQSII